MTGNNRYQYYQFQWYSFDLPFVSGAINLNFWVALPIGFTDFKNT